MSRSTRAHGRSVVSEVLEPRRLLTSIYNVSTGLAGGGPLGDPDYDPNISINVTGTGSRGIYINNGEASTVTAVVSGLPAHTMVKVTAFPLTTPNVPDGETSTVTVSAEGRTRTFSQTANAFTATGDEFGKWWASSSGTLILVFTANVSANSSGSFAFGLDMEEYRPTIMASGGGDMTEAGAGSGSATFTVSRDLPNGWLGTPAGDDPVPDTTVTVSRGGTATFGVDYQHAPNSADLPDGSVTFTGSQSSKSFTVVPIDDSVAESAAGNPGDTENVTWEVNVPDAPTPAEEDLQFTASIVDDSDWKLHPWMTVESLQSSVTTQLGSSTTTYSQGVDDFGVSHNYRTVETYFETDTWNSVPGAEASSTDWGRPADLNFSIGYTNEESRTLQIGGEAHNFSLVYGQTTSAGVAYTYTGTDSKPGIDNTEWQIIGYVKHRRVFKTTTIAEADSTGNYVTQLAFSEDTQIEGDVAGSFGYVVKKRTREWLDEEHA